MAEAGQALLGIGMGTGETRAMDAAQHAVESPLLETKVEGARSILLSITGGRDLSLFEVNEAAKAVAEAAHPDANIIFGAMVDEKIQNEVWVTVVATGYGERPCPAQHAAGRPRARAGRPRADGAPHGQHAAAGRARRSRRARVPAAQVASPHMKGVVAAGHPLTAQAGADVLREGGNAVDAAIAAMLMSWVAESPLTGPGAGGFMLLHTSGGESHLFDFFVAAPGKDAPRPAGRARADRGPLLRGRGPGVPHRPRVERGLREPARDRGHARSGSARCRWPTSPRPPRGRRGTGSRSRR